MKLYEVPRNSWVVPVTDTVAPPDARPVEKGEPVLFHHIDGMYSYCRDMFNRTVFLPAWQEVKIVDNPTKESK